MALVALEVVGRVQEIPRVPLVMLEVGRKDSKIYANSKLEVWAFPEDRQDDWQTPIDSNLVVPEVLIGEREEKMILVDSNLVVWAMPEDGRDDQQIPMDSDLVFPVVLVVKGEE